MIDTSRWRWPVAASVAFRYTRAPLGELSHFNPQFPFRSGPIDVGSSEALHQAFKFPRHPDMQLAILRAPGPRAAKRIGRSHGALLRTDRHRVRVDVMHAVVVRKTLAHRARIEAVLRTTVGRWIVEESIYDAFWGRAPHR